MMSYFWYIVFMFVSFAGLAQIFPAGNIDVIHNSNKITNPWAGGMDLPQFSSSDINSDGKKDLIVFDKKGNVWLIYLNEGNSNFKYAPQYSNLFPQVTNMALMRDFNCDGYADIFAHVNQGIQVFKNTHQGGHPSFVLEKSILKYEASWGLNIIYKFNGDIPAVEDFDGDGDMDILSFDLLGTTIPFYKNLSIEQGFGCDSMIFEENTVCWGHFKESNIDNSVQLNFMCKGNAGLSSYSGLEAEAMHTGSTLAIFDEDGDGDKDLLLGDISYNNLVFLKNGGTSTLANMVSFEDDFPNYNTSINVPIFPASFYVDVNDDGVEDLLISPSSYTSSVNKDCVWYYENTENASARFSLVKKNFLVETQIDYGSYSNITFFDNNADGLQDMIVGNGYIYDEFGATNSSLYYYENTGSASEPEFTLLSQNFANANGIGLEFMKPTFGDIDGDGDQDMLIGEKNGALHLFVNSAGAGNTASLSLTTTNYFNIDIGNYSTPQLVDLNEDGLLDIVVGRNSPIGNVAYYRNFGTSTVPAFHPDTVNAVLGGIHVEDPGFLFGYSAPFITKADANGDKYIYVGSDLGFIHKYKINMDSLEDGTFNEIDDAILEVRAGKRTSINIIDINNDGEQDYFIGSARGGVQFYSDVITDSTLILAVNKLTQNTFEYNIYPNPTKDKLTIEIENRNSKQINIEIVNLLGEVLFKTNFKKERFLVDIKDFTKGVYFVKVQKGKEFIVEKIIKN